MSEPDHQGQTPDQQDQTPIESPAQAPQHDKTDADADMEREIAEALGDGSLIDLYGMGEEPAVPSQPKPSAQAKGKPTSGSSRTDVGVCRGKVIAISGDDIFVDLGGKSQGLLPRNELEANEEIAVGAELDVMIVRYDAQDGLLILSKKGAEERLAWHDLQEGSRVEGLVTGKNKGGLELVMKGIKLFMPASQIDMYRVEDFEQYVGQKLVCEVTQVDRGDKNVVVSRRNVLEHEAEAKKEELWAELEKGQTRHGIVRSLMDYGAFVDLGGADGLLHVRDMSWARVGHPREILTEGQAIDVVVIGLDPDQRRISLSLKQAGGDPWTVVEQKYFANSKHQAQITKLMDFGAFAELEPGIEGLIPIGQMTWAGRVRHPSDVVQVGATVEVEVLTVDVSKRRISLSMKQVQGNPWENVAGRYEADQVCTGKVCRLTDFGAFVTLEEGIDGLIHISQLSDKRVNKVEDVLQEGQEVQAKVLSVDTENRRISLSLKGLTEKPADEPTTTAPEKNDAKKKDRPRRGGLTW